MDESGVPVVSVNGDAPTTPVATPATWEAFVSGQPDEIKGLFEGHVSGLKAALSAERAEKSRLSAELKSALKKVESGSEAEKTLVALAARLDLAEKKAMFAEQAVPQNCVNIKAAWALATQEEYWKADGSPDWATLKKDAPELFRRPPVVAPGSGAGTQPPADIFDMNSIIRQAAGRRS